MRPRIIVAAVVVALSASVVGVVKAENLVIDADANAKIEAGVRSSTRVSAEASSSGSDEVRDTSTTREYKDDTGEQNEEASSTTETKGDETSENHRSVVATFVSSLLRVANREGGIGAEVRAVAQAQNESASTTAEAIIKVEERGAVSTFFFGSDYKNLGVIRSEISTTKANITRLKAVLGRASSIEDRAELTVQIDALEAEQLTLNAYVTAHENIFSLFGWFAKLFVE